MSDEGNSHVTLHLLKLNFIILAFYILVPIEYNCMQIYDSSSVVLNMCNMPWLSGLQVAVSADFKSGPSINSYCLFKQKIYIFLILDLICVKCILPALSGLQVAVSAEYIHYRTFLLTS